MVIGTVDAALESLLRATLPLPAEVGDVSFDAPDRSWGASLSRITVNLFLFDVSRSPQPPRPPDERLRPDGRIERRPRATWIGTSAILAVACLGLGGLAIAGGGWLARWVPRYDPLSRRALRR